jgi:AraC-like DNA-binding protein
MDALSELLSAVRLTGAVFFNGEFTAPWGFEAARVDKLATLLPAGTERLLIYHFVIEGQAELRTASSRTALTAGDLVVLPHGDTHTFADGGPRSFLNGTDTLLRTFGTTDLNLIRYGGGGAPTRFICGYFGCERDADQLFLGGLPAVIKVHLRDDAAGRWLERSICDLLRDGKPGQRALLSKMAEALFIETLRRYMAGLPAGHVCWLAAARDPVVGPALALLHRDPRHRWSVAELASRAGASRSVIGERFLHLLGTPPLAYLARWRLRLAARLLETTRRTVTQVAGDVGYESDAAFSRAFKREFGTSPARHRRRLDAGIPSPAAVPLRHRSTTP